MQTWFVQEEMCMLGKHFLVLAPIDQWSVGIVSSEFLDTDRGLSLLVMPDHCSLAERQDLKGGLIFGEVFVLKQCQSMSCFELK